ncbi:hypothetical protein Bca52824_082179 [Brassica carinata]|uniref:DUF4283 domain-containing protein n=1 Tax=Brassica carinata TaxID=52824 RepID=A0A8X7PJD8_BRACI|nr:hypothetical protein Bca52824_082179 [Brassica carinata]
MDDNLAGVMQGMSLEDDVPIVLPEDDDYSAIGNMARMLRTMPKIWRVYERVRGIALTKESFQSIFELESDIQTVLKQGFWTFNDWGMAMERWVEHPPSNFLQTAAVWIIISKFRSTTSPLKPLMRAQVVMDLSLPVREKKSVTLPKGGGTAVVDVDYERIRKKCFHCFKLSHEKHACRLLKGNPSGSAKGKEKHNAVNLQRLTQRLIAPEVFEQMQLYMNCIDPEERRIREFRMKKAMTYHKTQLLKEQA